MQICKSLPYKKIAVFVFIFCQNTLTTQAQTGIDTALANTLQHSIDSMCTAYNVKGISAAAFIPGKGVWKGVTGVTYGSVPIDTTMILSIGSITKTFIAAEIFNLIDAGMLSLSDTLGDLLPPMTNVNPAITVEQLLSHTSGMGDFTNPTWQAAMIADLTAFWYFPDALVAFVDPPAGVPGSPFKYCNANYSLLGMIIEAKMSDSLHRVLRTDLLTPNGLSNTYMEIIEPYPNPIPHNWTTPTLDPALASDAFATPHEALWSSAEAAGGYFSDPADLATWAYNLYSGNILSAASLSEMLSFTPVSGSFFNGYGRGAMRFNSGGRTYYGHGGNYFGYSASMLYYPTDSISVAVLINQDCIAYYEARILMNTLINKLTTKIREPALKNLLIIGPNPADGELTIRISGNRELLQISITDITGKEMINKSITTTNTTINTQDLGAGTYFVIVTNGDASVSKQIVIAH